MATGWLIAGWLFISGLACHGPESEPESEPPPEVLFTGCGRVLEPADDPVCILRHDGGLNLFVQAKRADQIEVEGASVSGRAMAGTGWLLTLEDARPGRLVVSVEEERPRGRARWRLELRPPDVSPEVEALLDLWFVSEDESELLPETKRLLHTARGMEHADLLALQGRLVAGQGQVEGLRLGDEALNLFRDAGSLSDQVVLITGMAATAEELEKLPALPRGHYESAYLAAFHRGLMADTAFDARSAVSHFQTAVDLTARLDDNIRRVESELALADQLARLGLIKEAADKFEGLLGITEGLAECEQATVWQNIAWNRLLGWEQLRFSSSRPATDEVDGVVRRLREVERVYHAHGCWQYDAMSLDLDLALAHLLAGRFDLTRDNLERARSVNSAQASAERLLEFSWLLEIEARLLAAEGHGRRALEKYSELARGAAGFLEPTWRAQVGGARIQWELGDAEALDTFQAAESTLDAMLLNRPIEGGRYLPVEPGTRAFLEFLLAEDQQRQAFEVARHAYARPLRVLLVDHSDETYSSLFLHYSKVREQAAAQALALRGLSSEGRLQHAAKIEETRRQLIRIQNELFDLTSGEEVFQAPGAKLEPGEVLLLYHPLPSGWAGFALEADGTLTYRPLPPLDTAASPEWLTARLLKPFEKVLSEARRLRILPHGALWAVDFHALPWENGPLSAVAPVVYSLDLPPITRRSSDRAFVYRSPTLEHSRRDAAAAQAALADRGLIVDSPDKLSGSALHETLKALESPPLAWAHFSTHAEVAGPGGLRSRLELGAGSWLMASDLLASQASPEVVVLAACESGGSDSSPQGLSVAKAFLLAGSSIAVAAVRSLDDADAAELMAAFYRFLSEADAAGQHPPTIEEALRRARLEVRGSALRQAVLERGAWANFRVIVR